MPGLPRVDPAQVTVWLGELQRDGIVTSHRRMEACGGWDFYIETPRGEFMMRRTEAIAFVEGARIALEVAASKMND